MMTLAQQRSAAARKGWRTKKLMAARRAANVSTGEGTIRPKLNTAAPDRPPAVHSGGK